jgi:hypothetical protein
MFRKKTEEEKAEEKAREVLENPMAREKLEKLEREEFVKNTPLNDINAFKVFLYHNKINFDDNKVNSRDDIEDFAVENQLNLKPFGRYTGLVGDTDWAGRGKSKFETDYLYHGIEETIYRCGKGSIRLSMPLTAVEMGKPLENAKILQELGIEIKLRETETSTRGIIVDQRKDEKGSYDFIKALFWKRIPKDTGYVKKGGEPQKKMDMNTYSWSMEWTDGDEQSLQAEVLIPLSNRVYGIWNSQVKTIDDIIKERETLNKIKEMNHVGSGNSIYNLD